MPELSGSLLPLRLDRTTAVGSGDPSRKLARGERYPDQSDAASTGGPRTARTVRRPCRSIWIWTEAKASTTLGRCPPARRVSDLVRIVQLFERIKSHGGGVNATRSSTFCRGFICPTRDEVGVSLSRTLVRDRSRVADNQDDAHFNCFPTNHLSPFRGGGTRVRMIPSVISPGARSDAERRVFELLQRTPGRDAVCYHSVNLSEHEYKRVGELDFVIVTPEGVLVLEVKGGGVARRDGVWFFTDRYGVARRRSEGPFQQARSGMFSLRRRIEEHLTPGLLEDVPFGYGVVFPDCEFRERNVEWTDEMVWDRDAVRTARDGSLYLRRLFNYWKTKQRHVVEPSAHILRRIGELLRGDFEKVASLRVRADQLDAEMERLTHGQFAVLDAADRAPRVLCEGGAGTGKTFIAAELARRDMSRGWRTLLVCASPVLAAFLRGRLASSGVDVAVAPDGLPTNRVYDSLFVDEGQDLLNIPTLDLLDRALVGGLAHGRWRFFHDANRQAGVTGRFEPEALQLLESYGAFPLTLNTNCRNTKPVVLQTRLVTSADLGAPMAGDGPPVQVEWVSSEEHAAALVDARLTELRERDVPPGEITILSPKAIHESCVRRTKAFARDRLTRLDQAIAASWPPNVTTFASIAEFKGLENRFILVVDIEELDRDPSDVNSLYVAMSRARASLWMAVDQRLTKTYHDIQMRNLPHVMKDAAVAVAERVR